MQCGTAAPVCAGAVWGRRSTHLRMKERVRWYGGGGDGGGNGVCECVCVRARVHAHTASYSPSQ